MKLKLKISLLSKFHFLEVKASFFNIVLMFKQQYNIPEVNLRVSYIDLLEWLVKFYSQYSKVGELDMLRDCI